METVFETAVVIPFPEKSIVREIGKSNKPRKAKKKTISQKRAAEERKRMREWNKRVDAAFDRYYQQSGLEERPTFF